MKILSFGHIPTWAGGRQEQGLANVIYNLGLYISQIKNVEIKIAATDVFVDTLKVDNLEILGWTRKKLILYAFSNPILSMLFLFNLCIRKCNHKHNFSILNYFFKGLHLHRSLKRVKPELVHLHCAHSLVYLPVILSSKDSIGVPSEFTNASAIIP